MSFQQVDHDTFEVTLNRDLMVHYQHRPDNRPDLVFEFTTGKYQFRRAGLGFVISGVNVLFHWSSAGITVLYESKLLLTDVDIAYNYFQAFFQSYFNCFFGYFGDPLPPQPSVQTPAQARIHTCACGFQTPYPIALSGKYECSGCKTWGQMGA